MSSSSARIHQGDAGGSLTAPAINSLSFGEKFELMAEILGSVSSKDRLRLLKGSAGLFGHRVMPGSASPVLQVPQAPKVGQRPKAPAQPKSSDAKQKRINAEIRELNSQIKRESAKVGSRLSESHDLMQARQRLFRAKRGKEASAFSSDTEEEH